MNCGRLVVLLFFGFVASTLCRDRTNIEQYAAANCDRQVLTIFPVKGAAVVLRLPATLDCVGFSLDGKSVLAVDLSKPKAKVRNVVRVEFNPTRVSVAGSQIAMQSNRSPDGRWVADLDGQRGKLVLRAASDPSQTKAFGPGGIMAPGWSLDSRYLLLEKWQWRCGVNFDVEVPETLEILDVQTRKRSTLKSSRCQAQFGVNGFVSTEIADLTYSPGSK
jgi:hypothetical protein